MPGQSEIVQLIAKRDAAHTACIDARNEVGKTYSDFLTAQDELAEAILKTGTDTVTDSEGNEHTARRAVWAP